MNKQIKYSNAVRVHFVCSTNYALIHVSCFIKYSNINVHCSDNNTEEFEKNDKYITKHNLFLILNLSTLDCTTFNTTYVPSFIQTCSSDL